MYKAALSCIRACYSEWDHIPLHAPVLGEAEKISVMAMLDSGFVSSVGEDVSNFEQELCRYTGIRYAVAVVNGTAALELSLLVSGVKPNDEVITQPLSFIATANAIQHCGATPVFTDIDAASLSLSPLALEHWLENNTQASAQGRVNINTGRRVRACIPMHTFGHPAQMSELVDICQHFGIILIEDAAESLGSWIGKRHSGSFGCCAAVSFNGNKIITAGGGGALLTNDKQLALRARHLSTTAKINHSWYSEHDEVGFNWRMPNINAALVCAQLTRLPEFLRQKRALAKHYEQFFAGTVFDFIREPDYASSNYWLNTLRCQNKQQRDGFLKASAEENIGCRPPWQLLHQSLPYLKSPRGDLSVAESEADLLVNIPSSAGATL